MFFNRRKKTEIVLSTANLSALLIAFDALKACLGQDITFFHSTIRQKDRKSLNYKVTILGKLPQEYSEGSCDIDMSIVFKALVILTLREEPHYTFSPNDPIEIEMPDGMFLGQTLELVCVNGAYIVTEKTQPIIDDLRKRVPSWRKW